jgi:hypothetical protein
MIFADAPPAGTVSPGSAARYGIAARTEAPGYLNMPHLADGKIPALLSQTGAFRDTRNLIPAAGLIPYDLVVPFWSDGASKLRWAAIPQGKIKNSATGDWIFPNGTVFIKTFELPIDAANPGVKQRLETRLLVRDSAGGVYGVVYKWRPDNSDADLLATSLTEKLSGQTWYYPSRQDCLACHNAKTSGVLGVKSRQLNRTFAYPSGVTDNELRTWNHLGLLAIRSATRILETYSRLPPPTTRPGACKTARGHTWMPIARSATVLGVPSLILTRVTTLPSRNRRSSMDPC